MDLPSQDVERQRTLIAQTPKIGNIGPLNFKGIEGIDEADAQDEETHRESKKEPTSASKGYRLVSPQAERARNSLAERNKQQ